MGPSDIFYIKDMKRDILTNLELGFVTHIGIYYFGPSGVRALPLGVAVERSVHYFCDYISSSFFFLRNILFS